MKNRFQKSRARNVRGKIPVPLANRRAYWAAIGLASLTCGGALAQSTNAPALTPPAGTNTVPASAESGSSTNVTQLGNVTVVGQLNAARDQILPDLGATAYTIGKSQIATELQGGNVPFNQVILRAPGVAQDSAVNGDLHIRGEHANLQYRINGVILPEGITGFGLELDPRFVDSVQLITGALPAEYGFRTAGIVDIKTKSGAFEPGGDFTMYGGSYDTYRPSFEYGGAQGKVDYYVTGSYEHTALGIENPVGTANPIHDDSDQYKTFTYLSYLIDDTSRVSLMGSASYSTFQIPDQGGNTNAFFSSPGDPNPPGQPATLDSASVNERQNEQNYYGSATYQKSVGDFNLQASVFGRQSEVHFMPDPVGDLYFSGLASDVERTLDSGGVQADASYALGDYHTLRGGLFGLDEAVADNTSTTVYSLLPGNVDGNGISNMPAFPIVNDSTLHGYFAGVYLQDEWKIFKPLTLNYGARFDIFSSSFDHENQLSPRANLIYQPTSSTTLHGGYSRYFTPPPIENVSSATVAGFNGTSNQAASPPPYNSVKAERANYFDAGITQKLAPGLQVGVDGYYKRAKQQLDDGLFGQTLILSAFNYSKGEVGGVEFTSSYTLGGFNTYANLAYSVARGEDWDTAQFLFSPNDLAYVQNHYIYLDHDQRVTGSFGASYTFKESIGDTIADVDALYGSGLRQNGDGVEPNDPAASVPNGASVPSYYTINCGLEEDFKVGSKQHLKARLDIVNVTDNVYELRSATGVGVNLAQFGERRGFFGSLSYSF